MARLRYWLVAALFLTSACGTTGEETAATSHDVSERAQGFWVLEEYTVDGERREVEVGSNTASEAWVEIDTEAISGSSGCNDFATAGGYELDSERLTFYEVFSTAMGCVGDDGADLMEIESLFQELFWADPARIDVDFAGEIMLWRAGEIEFVFHRTGGPPAPPTTLPPQEMGQLDCSPGYVTEEVIDDSVRATEQILRDEVPEVVRTEEDLEFAPPAPEGWFWLGYDSDDNLIAFIARGDIEPPRYQLWTCAEG